MSRERKALEENPLVCRGKAQKGDQRMGIVAAVPGFGNDSFFDPVGSRVKPLAAILASVALSLFLSVPAWADYWDIASRFQLSMSAEEAYSDNIDLRHTNKLDDFITTISPALRFSSRPRPRLAGGAFRQAPEAGEENLVVQGEYHPGFVFYADNTGRNYVSHDGSLNLSYVWDRKVTLRLREIFRRSEEPREEEYVETALPGQYLLGTKRNLFVYVRNVVEPSLEYRFGRENLASITYRSNVYNTQDPSGQDSREDAVTPRINYWLDLRHGASFEYTITRGYFDQTPDLTGQGVKGRYLYRLDPYTLLLGEYAFSLRDFDTPKVRPPVPIFPRPPLPSLDYVIHNPSVGVERRFSPTLSGRLQAGYYWQIPDQGRDKNGPFFDLSLTRREERTTLTLSLRGGYREDFFTAQNLGFTKSYSALGAFSHRLAEKLNVGFRGGFERAISYEPDRKQNIWNVGGDLSYEAARWLSFLVSVTHRENHSSIASERYKENRGLFRITATY